MLNSTKIPTALALLLGDEDNGLTDADLGKLARWMFSPDDEGFPAVSFCEEAEDANPELVKAFAQLREHAGGDLEEVRDSVSAEVRKSLNRLSAMEADGLDEQVERLQRGSRALICPDAALADAAISAISASAAEEGDE